MKLDLTKIQPFIDEKYISVQKHPTEELYIYNYTQKTQFEGKWTEETMMCRGLITDREGTLIARPFKKFFNLDQIESLPAEDFEVFEKFDGSLGILYWIKDEPFIATRGSFISDQAIKGSEILRGRYIEEVRKLDRSKTYLFEIIYPQNRIVVDYDGLEDLIHLATIDTETGDDQSLEDIGFRMGPRYGMISIEKLIQKGDGQREGYVIKFKSGLRAKIKFDEYVRLHRIVTGTNSKTVWEMLRENKPMDELLERVPDEFHKWLENVTTNLLCEFKNIKDRALLELHEVEKFQTRKEQALYLKAKSKHSGLVFTLLDGKDPAPEIWKLIKPKAEKPFKQQDESNA